MYISMLKTNFPFDPILARCVLYCKWILIILKIHSGEIMKAAAKTLVPMLTGSATASFAATTGLEQGGNGMMLVWFFIGFGVMLVLFQAAPAIVMFASMMKGLFSSNQAEATFSPFKGKGEK